MTHTPGPWRAFFAVRNQRTQTGDWLFLRSDGIALLKNGKACEVDASVMAAAPDLLRSAKAAWHLCESLLAEREGATTELIVGVSVALRTAIAKAEGTP